jgi:hypothetical protein
LAKKRGKGLKLGVHGCEFSNSAKVRIFRNWFLLLQNTAEFRKILYGIPAGIPVLQCAIQYMNIDMELPQKYYAEFPKKYRCYSVHDVDMDMGIGMGMG